jgi:O-antigen/teichoic acid export membrane protein
LKKNFSKAYLKNYIAQALSFVLRFISLLIVVPYLSKDPNIYGIYALCVSVVVFLSYADLGFLASSTKYATESFSQSNRREEMSFIGFGGFLTLIISLLASVIFIYLSFNPEKLISNLESKESIFISSRLLITLAFTTPFIVLQRILSIIFEIRLKGYISKLITAGTNTIVIISTVFFFRDGNYLIVEYYYFQNLMIVVSVVFLLIALKYRLNYNLLGFFKSFRFSFKFFNLTKGLAFPSLLGTLSWVVFYELDQIVVGKLEGSKAIAFFALGLTFASLFRTIYGIIFEPFLVRANYLVGNNDYIGLNEFLKNILILAAPITVLPTIAFSLNSDYLIFAWVGRNYQDSIIFVKLFSLLFTFSFISYVLGIFLTSTARVKEMNIISFSMPFIYWTGVYSIYSVYGLVVFPIFKLVTIFFAVIYNVYLLIKYNIVSIKYLLNHIFFNLLISIFFLYTTIRLTMIFIPKVQSLKNFSLVLLITIFLAFCSVVLCYLITKKSRTLFLMAISSLKKV